LHDSINQKALVNISVITKCYRLNEEADFELIKIWTKAWKVHGSLKGRLAGLIE